MRKPEFHRLVGAKRWGGSLPRRLPIMAHRGVTLVELMISMLILAIVCMSWFEILSIQSAKREALRREGVERLAGMMEAFLVSFTLPNGISSNVGLNNIGDFQKGDAVLCNPDALAGGGGYMFTRILSSDAGSKVIHPIFSEEEIREGRIGAASPGYRLHVGTLGTDSDSAMNFSVVKDRQADPMMRNGAKILVGDLYERAGEIIDIADNQRGDTPRRICRLKLFMKNAY